MQSVHITQSAWPYLTVCGRRLRRSRRVSTPGCQPMSPGRARTSSSSGWSSSWSSTWSTQNANWPENTKRSRRKARKKISKYLLVKLWAFFSNPNLENLLSESHFLFNGEVIRFQLLVQFFFPLSVIDTLKIFLLDGRLSLSFDCFSLSFLGSDLG